MGGSLSDPILYILLKTYNRTARCFLVYNETPDVKLFSGLSPLLSRRPSPRYVVARPQDHDAN
jgi:hypothetical protein